MSNKKGKGDRLKDIMAGRINVLDILVSTYTILICLTPILSNRAVSVFGVKILVGVMGIPVVYGLSDVINNNWGLEKARQTVLTAFVVRLFIFAWIGMTMLLPTQHMTPGYMKIMTKGFRFLLAAEITLVVSQYFVDIPIFAWIKRRVKGGFWIRYNLSNVVSFTISATIFMNIAFWGTGKPIPALIFGSVFYKLIMSFCLTPFFEVLVRLTNEKAKKEPQ